MYVECTGICTHATRAARYPRAQGPQKRRLLSRLGAEHADCFGANATGTEGVNRLIKWLETSVCILSKIGNTDTKRLCQTSCLCLLRLQRMLKAGCDGFEASHISHRPTSDLGNL